MGWTFCAGWNACMVVTALRDGNPGAAAFFGFGAVILLVIALVLRPTPSGCGPIGETE